MYQQEILKLILKQIEKENVKKTNLMNRVFYEINCRCKKEISLTRKRKANNPSEGKPVLYPNLDELTAKTFQLQLKYEKKLSSLAKFVLTSFQKKYFYYAIDDILDLLKSNPIERDNLLTILYSTVLSLHNKFSINFFDVWIYEIHINEVAKTNKFLTTKSQNFEPFYYITITFLYRTKIPIKKQESLW